MGMGEFPLHLQMDRALLSGRARPIRRSGISGRDKRALPVLYVSAGRESHPRALLDAEAFALHKLPASELRRAVTTCARRLRRRFVGRACALCQYPISQPNSNVVFSTVPTGMCVALYQCAPGALGYADISSPGLRVSKTGIAFRRNSIPWAARWHMQTDYRQASSEDHVRAEAIAERLILWGVIATLIFLAVTMIRAA